jgi:hypothetical protein
VPSARLARRCADTATGSAAAIKTSKATIFLSDIAVLDSDMASPRSWTFAPDPTGSTSRPGTGYAQFDPKGGHMARQLGHHAEPGFSYPTHHAPDAVQAHAIQAA